MSKIDVITRVQSQLDSLSKAEKRIGELLLKNPQKFSTMNVRDIAGILEISEPTVIRFCRNVGFDGFKDLKFQLVQDIAVAQAILDAAPKFRKRKQTNSGKQEDADPLDHCYLCAVEALDQARVSLRPEEIASAAKMIASAGRVPIYGLGGSSSVLALEMHNRLFRLGVFSIPYTDSYLQRMSSASLDQGDVAIIISSTGRPRALLDSVELAKYYGAKCIGIAPKDSALARETDLCLHVELSQSGVYQYQPYPMRFAQLLTIDALAFKVAIELGDSAEDHLKRTRASVASLHGIAPHQPVGD